MRALAWLGKEDMRVIDAPIPDVSEPKDVIIKVSGTTICGSDLHLYHSEMLALKKGDILGHEFMYVSHNSHQEGEVNWENRTDRQGYRRPSRR